VNLTRLDHEDISRLTIKRLSVNSPHSTAFADELNLVIRVPMRPGPGPGFPVVKKYGNTRIALFSSDKLMRIANERQIFLAHTMHLIRPPPKLDEHACIQASESEAAGGALKPGFDLSAAVGEIRGI
jgi:hypothetical protein